MSKQKKRNEQSSNPKSRKLSAINGNKALIKIGLIVGILLFALVGFGAFASRQASNEIAATRRAANPAAPLPTPQYNANAPVKEYLYAGSKLLAVSEPLVPVPTDLAVWRQSTGTWYVLGGTSSSGAIASWGQNGDTPVPGDFDGDGKTDFSIFRPDMTQDNNGQWFIIYSSNNVISNYGFGSRGDEVAQADYDGDGKTDSAVYRPSTGLWYILRSSEGYTTFGWGGQPGDKINSADFDGDGRADLGIWRDSNKMFYSKNIVTGGQDYVLFTQSSTQPVSADYDGDGKADYAIKSGNSWVIRRSTTGTFDTTPITFKNASDTPVPNDYDGDGKCDIAVWRPADSTTGAGDAGHWYIRQSSLIGQSGEVREQVWGIPGDIPVPALYRR